MISLPELQIALQNLARNKMTSGALGMLGAREIGRFAGWKTMIEPLAVMVAVGFAGAVGIFFGAYPAFLASRLDPVEALDR